VVSCGFWGGNILSDLRNSIRERKLLGNMLLDERGSLVFTVVGTESNCLAVKEGLHFRAFAQ